MKSYCNLSSLVLFLTLCKAGFSQVDSSYKNSVVKSPIILSTGYRLPVKSNSIINSGHGLYFEFGINPIYFISKRQLLGIYCGIGTRDNFWNTSFDRKFVEDYSRSIESSDFQDIDLAIINSSKQLISEMKGRSMTFPGCQTSSFHTAALYYGILCRIPLPKYPLILKLYTGVNETSYRGGQIVTQQKEYNYFAIKRSMYGCEISLFPGIRKPNTSRKFENITRIFLGTVSLYYEYCDLYNARLYFNDGEQRISLPFKKYLSTHFLHQYKYEYSIGVRLAVNIY
jgi:hypothetical protein